MRSHAIARPPLNPLSYVFLGGKRDEWRRTSKEAKKEVAKAKANARREVGNQLELPGGKKTQGK